MSDPVGLDEHMGRPALTHVAIRFRGVVYSLPAPNRHHDVIAKIIREADDVHAHTSGDDQGFLDASGRYLTRQQALVSAKINNQLINGTSVQPNLLFSEDVW